MNLESVRKRIAELEKESERIKSMHFLSQISLSDAKQRISKINEEIRELLKHLPEHERELYNIKKELRSLDFYG